MDAAGRFWCRTVVVCELGDIPKSGEWRAAASRARQMRARRHRRSALPLAAESGSRVCQRPPRSQDLLMTSMTTQGSCSWPRAELKMRFSAQAAQQARPPSHTALLRACRSAPQTTPEPLSFLALVKQHVCSQQQKQSDTSHAHAVTTGVGGSTLWWWHGTGEETSARRRSLPAWLLPMRSLMHRNLPKKRERIPCKRMAEGESGRSLDPAAA